MKRLPLALTLLLGACAHGPSRHVSWTQAEGMAAIDPADRAGSLRRATLEALRAAVERAGGVWIASESKVSQAIAIEQQIRAAAMGRVTRYEVISQREQDGWARVRLRALVSPGSSQDRLRFRLGAVAVQPSDDEASRQAAAAVRRSLAASGIAIADGKNQARWLVSVTAHSEPLPSVVGLSSSRAGVTLEAKKTQADSWLAAERAQSSSIGTSALLAEQQALAQTARLASEKLVKALTQDARPF